MPSRKKPTAAPDHFAVLGIDFSATKREVKLAYMKLAREDHPDKGGDSENMKAINAAYEAITGKTNGNNGDGNEMGEDLYEDRDMEAPDSDGDYSQSDSQGEGDSDAVSASDSEVSEGADDEAGWAFGNQYSDLEETGGRYAVVMEDGREVSIKEHENICGCDLDAGDSPHQRKIAIAVGDNDDYHSDYHSDCAGEDMNLADDEDFDSDSGIEDCD